MDQRSLIIATVALSVVFLLVLFSGGGMDEEVQARARAEVSQFNDAGSKFTERRRHLEKVMSSESALFASPLYAEIWKRNLDEAASSLSTADAERKKVEQLLDENDPEGEAAVMGALPALSSARAGALATVEECIEAAERRVSYKRQSDDILAKADGRLANIEKADIAGTRGIVEQAIADWPGKKTDLERRLQGLERSATEGKAAHATLASMKGKDPADLDYDRFIAAATALRRAESTLAEQAGASGGIAKLIEQLYWSIDRMLVDMDIREGQTVQFYHRIQEIRTRVPNVEGTKATELEGVKADTQKKDPYWSQVTKARYEANKKNLGMVLEHKPGGKYDHEIEKAASAPGYAYMCPPEQKRNNYGYWNSGPGGSFWVWYGQYALMRDLFWGPRYSPVYADSWRDYRDHRTSGRTWYGKTSDGRTPRYGSDSRFGKTRYSGSRYVSSGGFKNTRYVRSGGSYRGSRFEPRSRSGSRSSSRSSGGTRRSASSRSFRSGSRFGGGK